MASQADFWVEQTSSAGDGFAADPSRWPVAADWRPLVDAFFGSASGRSLLDQLRHRQADGEIIFPANPLRALQATPLAQVRVVVVGQDPYPTAGHADGLAFSAMKGRPKSLARIAEVLAADRSGWKPPAHSRLDAWADQGVLLLNTALTVAKGQAGAHLDIGWHSLSSEVLKILASKQAVKFMLWGSKAQDFAAAAWQGAAPSADRVLATRHPSYDFYKRFMAEGSHFAATAELVDWWAWR
jgi:uracil-DNA glycosylase